MKNKASSRGIFFKIAAILILLIIAAVMFVIGRGHTVYIDNKSIDYNGETYKAFNRVNVYVDGERIGKLAARERGKSVNIGQEFKMITRSFNRRLKIVFTGIDNLIMTQAAADELGYSVITRRGRSQHGRTG